jgi:LuxR family maltose regulon positive regulatory protein
MEAGDEFVAVATKLLVPELRAGLVPRPALIGALESGRTRRATLIAAATGFGKTSALAEWAAASPARFAWLSLDEGDDAPSRFWSYLVAAIDRAAPELPGTARRRLRGPAWRSATRSFRCSSTSSRRSPSRSCSCSTTTT